MPELSRAELVYELNITGIQLYLLRAVSNEITRRAITISAGTSKIPVSQLDSLVTALEQLQQEIAESSRLLTIRIRYLGEQLTLIEESEARNFTWKHSQCVNESKINSFYESQKYRESSVSRNRSLLIIGICSSSLSSLDPAVILLSLYLRIEREGNNLVKTVHS